MEGYDRRDSLPARRAGMGRVVWYICGVEEVESLLSCDEWQEELVRQECGGPPTMRWPQIMPAEVRREVGWERRVWCVGEEGIAGLAIDRGQAMDEGGDVHPYATMAIHQSG